MINSQQTETLSMQTAQTSLYPLRFKTIFKEKLWGGKKIQSVLGKDFGDLSNCGETWEISGVKGNVSVVAEGPLAGKSLRELIQEYKAELVGEAVYEAHGDEFPLLVKFIDANDDLSIQVHPDDALAKERHDSKGKTEMWYIMQADEGATLISGFNQEVSREIYEKAFQEGELMSILNRENVDDGDVFFLPAGRVHTIGKGLLLAEIQQTSDITYRIYDFDRKDAQGNTRELHVEQALDAIDYGFYEDIKTSYVNEENAPVELASCDYFKTDKLHFTEPTTRNHQDKDSFVIYVVVDGALSLEFTGGKMDIKKGEAILLPASLKEVTLTPKGHFTLLESFVPAS